jgi:foldase protein PrsA
MTRRFVLPLLSLAVLAAVAAGCGGGGGKKSSTTPAAKSCDAKLGPGVIATVCSATVTKGQFDQVLQQARRQYKLQKRAFPAAGSPDYQTLVGQIVNFLVQRAEYAQKAAELGVTVTDKQIADRLQQIKKQFFNGNEKRYQQALKQQGVTDADIRQDIRSQLISQGIQNKVTKSLTVTDADVSAYYKQHLNDLYTQPARTDPPSRDVRHILVKTKKKAVELENKLKAGASFATLAKQNTLDTSSKATGGKLTISKGQTVPPFDKVAFSLKNGQISAPVHTQFGWHIIQALSAVKPAKKVPKKVTPLSQVKASIRTQLLSEKKTNAIKVWSDKTTAEFEPTIHYATGYAPPSTAASTTEAAPTTTG